MDKKKALADLEGGAGKRIEREKLEGLIPAMPSQRGGGGGTPRRRPCSWFTAGWRLSVLLAVLLMTLLLLSNVTFPMVALPWVGLGTLNRATLVNSNINRADLVKQEQRKAAYRRQHAHDGVLHDVTEDSCRDVATAATVKGLRHKSPELYAALVAQRTAYTYLGESRFKRCTQDVRGDEVPALRHVITLRSQRRRKFRAVTLVTQLSLDRLFMLENQCRRWDSPVAAVVYMPLAGGRLITMDDGARYLNGTDVSEGIRLVHEFHMRMEEEGSCHLDIEFVVEERCNIFLASMYPFNALRNRALMVARTDAVILLDVDFVASTPFTLDLGNSKSDFAWLSRLLRTQHAVVLPAFQTADRYEVEAGVQAALRIVDGGKPAALAALANGTISPFQIEEYPAGHTPTDYSRWKGLPSRGLRGEYGVEFKTGYEPYVIMHKDFVPWYDERFRGYGWDKVIHLLHISRMNTTFVVHPRAFVVHVPHTRSATQWLTKVTRQREVLHDLFVEVKTDIFKQKFVPVTSFPHMCG